VQPLSDAQKIYAATDAYVRCVINRIYNPGDTKNNIR
jgi:hypothetical protein